MLRVFRVSEVIANLNQSPETKASYKVLNLTFNMIVYIHMWACVW